MNACAFVARGKKKTEEDLPYMNLEPHILILTGKTTLGAENEPAVGRLICLFFSKWGNLRENNLGLLSIDQDCQSAPPLLLAPHKTQGSRDNAACYPTRIN